MIEKSAGVQGRRPDRRHLRRGQPAVHLHRATASTTPTPTARRSRDKPNADRRSRRPTQRARTSSAATSTPSRPGRTRPWPPTPRVSQLYPGPGDNGFIDRPPACTQTTPTLVPANCVPGIVRGGSGNSPGARTDTVAALCSVDLRAGQLDPGRRHRPRRHRHRRQDRTRWHQPDPARTHSSAPSATPARRTRPPRPGRSSTDRSSWSMPERQRRSPRPVRSAGSP